MKIIFRSDEDNNLIEKILKWVLQLFVISGLPYI
jgi:hypothetical protein